MPGLGGLPDRGIERVVLTRIVRTPPVLRGKPQRLGAVQARLDGGGPAREVDGAVALVGGADRDQAPRPPDDVLYRPVRAQFVPRTLHVERGQAVFEVVL